MGKGLVASGVVARSSRVASADRNAPPAPAGATLKARAQGRLHKRRAIEEAPAPVRAASDAADICRAFKRGGDAGSADRVRKPLPKLTSFTVAARG
jgi:hypothetical protein